MDNYQKAIEKYEAKEDVTSGGKFQQLLLKIV